MVWMLAVRKYAFWCAACVIPDLSDHPSSTGAAEQSAVWRRNCVQAAKSPFFTIASPTLYERGSANERHFVYPVCLKHPSQTGRFNFCVRRMC